MQWFFKRIFPWPFVIAGALTLVFGVRNMLRAGASADWPTAAGAVKVSSVEYHKSNEGGGTYHAEVMYEYMAGGTLRSGNRVAFGDYGSSNSSRARGIVNKYPVGRQVTVHHDPDDPDVSVLEPGLKGQAWLLPAFGGVFLGVGALMVVGLPKLMRKTQAAAATEAKPQPDQPSEDENPYRQAPMP